MAQTVVINQGSGPLGVSLARRFGQAGAQVVIIGRDLAAWTAAQTTLTDAGLTVRLESLDSRVAGQCAELADRLGSIDVWINQAGLGRAGPADSFPAQLWEAQLTDVLTSAFFGAQAAARVMLAQGRGVIVNLTSAAGQRPLERNVAFNVASAGLVALTESLGVEWAPHGLRVVGIALIPDGAERNLPRLPLRRLGTPDEIAEAVAFLASDQAAYVTAETLRVDGGWGAYQLF
jgi:NAD(P)-dependent dehydrogenase (short-subunit alcohol dehydrogenase family)